MSKHIYVESRHESAPTPRTMRPQVHFNDGVPEHIKIMMQACRDIEFLIEGHARLILPTLKVTTNADGQEIIPDVESVFIYAGVVLLVSNWEAFIEEVACKGFEFLLENCATPEDLPLELRKQVAKEIKSEKNELSPWKLAGDGWKRILEAYKEEVLNRTARNFNTPKPARINELFESLLCLKNATQCWQWSNYDPATIIGEAAKLVEFRGAIAHGKKPNEVIGCNGLHFYLFTLQQLAALTSNAVNSHLIRITGKRPWSWIRFDTPILRCNEIVIPSGEDDICNLDEPSPGPSMKMPAEFEELRNEFEKLKVGIRQFKPTFPSDATSTP